MIDGSLGLRRSRRGESRSPSKQCRSDYRVQLRSWQRSPEHQKLLAHPLWIVSTPIEHLPAAGEIQRTEEVALP